MNGYTHLNWLSENKYPRHGREGSGGRIDVLRALELEVKLLKRYGHTNKADRQKFVEVLRVNEGRVDSTHTAISLSLFKKIGQISFL